MKATIVLLLQTLDASSQVASKQSGRFHKSIDIPPSPAGLTTMILSAGALTIHAKVSELAWSEPLKEFVINVSFDTNEPVWFEQISKDKNWMKIQE